MKTKSTASSTPRKRRMVHGSPPQGINYNQADDALREYQSILATAEQVARIGSWKWDLRTQKVTWSEEMFRLFAVEQEGFDGDMNRVIAERIHPEDMAAVAESNRSVLENGEPRPLSYRILLPDGTERTVWAQGRIVPDETGRPVALMGYVQDISERVRAEKKILQLKRLYATMSQVNQVIVRVNEPGVLFRMICDVAVQFGEFALAWVGLLDERSGELRPVASNGWDVQRWPFPHINIYQQEYGQTLTVQAIRTASVVTSENIHTDARLQSFAGQIKHYPYQASAIVPIRLRGKVIGVLALSSRESGVFQDQAEVSLLEEMGLDISFALDSMENEKERRQAEKALQESENKYRDLVETSQDGIFISQQDRIIFINGRGLEMLGAAQYEQVIGRSPLEIFHPDFHPLIREQIRQMPTRQVTVPTVEEKIVTLDGRIVPVEVTAASIMVNGIPSIQVILRDITGRKRAEEALHLANARFQRMVESNIMGIAIAEADGRVLLANDYYLNLLNVTRQDFLEGKVDWRRFTPPEWLPADEKAIQELREHGICKPYEKEYVRADGTRVGVLIADALFTSTEEQIIGFVLDITERKQAEEKLRQSEERYRLISENTADVIWVLDPLAGVFKYISPSVEKMRGYTAAEIMERPINEALTPESFRLVSRQLAEHLSAFLEKGSGTESFVTEVDQPCRDGSIVHTEVTTTTMFNQQGQVEIIGVSRNITERRRTERALRENEERLRLSLQAANQGLYDLNVQSGAAIVNREYAEMLGYDPGTFVETNARWIERLHPGDQASVAKAYQDYINGLRPEYRIEFRQRTRDGNWKWILSLGQIIEWDSKGNPLRMLGTHTDITERKHAEERLRASEERYRNLVENMNDIVMEVDASGNYCYLSPNFATISDYPIEAELGGPALKHIHPDDLPMVVQKLGQAFHSEKQSAVYRVQKSNGEWRWLETVGKPYPASDGSMHLITVARDITERKQAEDALKRNEQVLRLFVEHSPASIAMFDREMRYIVASRRYLSDYRLGEQDLTGRTHYEVFPEIPARWKEIHQRCLQGAVERCNEDAFPREDGQLDWVRWEIRPWYEQAGSIGGIILFSEVITARKQAEDELKFLNIALETRVAERTMELRRLNLELQSANKAKTEFLANMSHELRTPLNTVLGLSESLLEQRRGPLNEKQIQSLGLIVSSGQHLLDLINDILEVSKIEAGKLELHPSVVSVREVCESSLNFVRQLALKKSILVELNYDSSLSVLRADPQRLKQILINLLTNAVKFTPDRGKVSLDVCSNLQRDQILFSITDNGIGIAVEDIRKLFTPFTQLDSSLSRQYAGTGLGLSLVEKLADLHGGSVQVESEVGQGSRFTVVLPLYREELQQYPDTEDQKAAQGEQASRSALPDRRCVVLLAEDNAINAGMVAEYLEAGGHKVLIAQDGEKVLEKAFETRPDIILMDIQMPKMDGLEATRRLRTDERFVSTPIIALTALAMPGDKERCLEAGVNEYLSKPVSLKKLSKVIARFTEPDT